MKKTGQSKPVKKTKTGGSKKKKKTGRPPTNNPNAARCDFCKKVFADVLRHIPRCRENPANKRGGVPNQPSLIEAVGRRPTGQSGSKLEGAMASVVRHSGGGSQGVPSAEGGS